MPLYALTVIPRNTWHEDLDEARRDAASKQTTSCSASDVTGGSKGWGSGLSLFITRANLCSCVSRGSSSAPVYMQLRLQRKIKLVFKFEFSSFFSIRFHHGNCRLCVSLSLSCHFLDWKMFRRMLVCLLPVGVVHLSSS